MKDELWTQRDGVKIFVGDMSLDHLRNTLRMIIRARRKRAKREAMRIALGEALDSVAECDAQDMLNAEHYRMLANPNAFFPLLNGGVYGSPDLQKNMRENYKD